jgi:hypothetical protein
MGAESAALTPNLDAVVSEVQADLDQAASEHLDRLTQDALRKLNTPSSLARCGLLSRLPQTISRLLSERQDPSAATPLEQAQALRECLVAAIERLKPPAGSTSPGDPGALQYNILREEYVLGLPNKQIMVRHSISEGTFHRNRRQAISALAQELSRQEELLQGAPLASH